MRSFIKVLLGIFIVLFAISGLFSLLGAALHLTFGILGVILSFIWNIVSNPVVLILIVVYLIYKLNKTSSSK